jgi:hypothetical protein
MFGLEFISPGGGSARGERAFGVLVEHRGEPRDVTRICEICFEEIPADQPVVRARRRVDGSPHEEHQGRVEGPILRCCESCWQTLERSGTFRRLDAAE